MSFHPLGFLAYVFFLIKEVLVGAARVARYALAPSGFPTPAIVELGLDGRTDLEIALMASSITITPGTLVVGTAAARYGAPPTLYVHCVLGDSRADTLAGLHDMERRLLRATRGRRVGKEVTA